MLLRLAEVHKLQIFKIKIAYSKKFPLKYGFRDRNFDLYLLQLRSNSTWGLLSSLKIVLPKKLETNINASTLTTANLNCNASNCHETKIALVEVEEILQRWLSSVRLFCNMIIVYIRGKKILLSESKNTMNAFYWPKNVFFKERYEKSIINTDLQWNQTRAVDEVLKHYY